MSQLTVRALELRMGERCLCRALDLHLKPGQFWAVLGLNGSGKSTLLHTLAGLRPPSAGTVELNGRPLTELSRRAIARLLGLLTQDSQDPFPATVMETALTGRHPHLTPWQRESEADRALAWQALVTVELEALATRQVATLSGGERRRLALATLLTQSPPLMLLDEPANHLDLPHQHRALNHLRGLVDKGCTAMAVLHDPNLAARYCDHLLLMFGDGRWRAGRTTELLKADLLSELYGCPVSECGGPHGPVFVGG